MIHAISTGQVKITRNWLKGKGTGAQRLANTLLDKTFSDWLPIWCYLIEHEGRLILIDTGISQATNTRRYFPPHLLLSQRAAKFSLQPEEEIGPQIRKLGFDPKDVDMVILTHLHQDHDGGLHYFPNAEFIVSRGEWDVATGFAGRMGGYLNQLWPKDFEPRLVDFVDETFADFSQSYPLAEGLRLVPTPGHSAGQMSVILDRDDVRYLFIGDTAYSEAALINDITDGITTDVELAKRSMRQIRSVFLEDRQNIVLPSHDPAVPTRLAEPFAEKGGKSPIMELA